MSLEKPSILSIETLAEFDHWYWLKSELVVLCKHWEIPSGGNKLEIRDRIRYFLAHDSQLPPPKVKVKNSSRFDWAKATLSLETVITDNVKFGPNFRRFMKVQIGPSFSCHSDFMDWVKAHPGKTLADAVLQWEALESRKDDPHFQRSIAQQNMLAQYVRDFLADNPGRSFREALHCWKEKKKQPAPGGQVQYDQQDLSALDA